MPHEGLNQAQVPALIRQTITGRMPQRMLHTGARIVSTPAARRKKKRYSTRLTTTFCRTAVIEREIGLKPDGFIKIIAATFLSGLLV